MNPGLGVLLLVVTLINLTNPHIREYYAALGVGVTGLYVMAVLRVALAGALIFGRDRRVAMALRAAFFLGAVAFALLPDMAKALAYPIGAVAALILYRLTPPQDFAHASAGPAGIAGFASQIARMFGLVCATSGAMCVAILAVRAGLLGDSQIVQQVRGVSGSIDTHSATAIAAATLTLAAALIVRATQRVTTMVLCVWTLGIAGAQLAAGHGHFVAGTLVWAAIFGVMSSALPRPASQSASRFDAGTLGCLGFAALLAFAGMWDVTSVRVGEAYVQAGYPAGFGIFVGGVDFLASVLLCVPAARPWALGGFATFSIAYGAIGVMHGRVADAPMTVFALALCVGLLATISRRVPEPMGRLVNG